MLYKYFDRFDLFQLSTYMKKKIPALLLVALLIALLAVSISVIYLDETPTEPSLQKPTAPTDPTEPPVTDPPITEPPETEPPATEPPTELPTEPKPTEPKPTEPENTDPTALPTVWTPNCNEFIGMWDASGKVFARIPKGETMQLLSWDYTSAKVSYNGMTGYVATNYIMPADPDYFEKTLSTIAPTNLYTYDQMLEDIKLFEQKYPDIIDVSSIGVSELGRNLPVIRIGKADAKYNILLQGAIHGREHMTAWLLMAMTDYWLERDILGYGDVCYHIIPMMNPDGVTISQTGKLNDAQNEIYLSDKKNGFVSGNKTTYATDWKANGMGVDLNRNFPSGWEKLDDRSGPSSQKYQGAAPFSASETSALRDYTLSYDFDVTVSYHSSGDLIYWSYGNKTGVNNASKSLAKAVRSVSGYVLSYDNEGSVAGYKDWAQDELEIPSITIEIGRSDSPLAMREIYSVFVRNCQVLPAIARWVQKQ